MRWFEELCYTLGMSASCPDLCRHLTLGDFGTRQGHSGFSFIKISLLGGLLLKRKRMWKQITNKGLQGNLGAWSSNEKMPGFFVTRVRPEIVLLPVNWEGWNFYLCLLILAYCVKTLLQPDNFWLKLHPPLATFPSLKTAYIKVWQYPSYSNATFPFENKEIEYVGK